MDSRQTTVPATAKRKRSSSGEAPAPAVKPAKTHINHLQINYLARQFSENLPVVSPEDTLPSILTLIGDYDGVLQRHESMAGNLGAKPLGPILIKRFERLFDGPPRVLKTHGKEGTTVSWLDVVEFARNKPEQFNLEKMRNGVRVCQFYTKQSRVEISEEDYVLIASGMPQKLIPPQPIVEDEEKELGTLKILEKNLTQIVQLADQGKHRLLVDAWVPQAYKFLICNSLSSRETAEPSSQESEERNYNKKRSRSGRSKESCRTLTQSCRASRVGKQPAGFENLKSQRRPTDITFTGFWFRCRQCPTSCSGQWLTRTNCARTGNAEHQQRHDRERRVCTRSVTSHTGRAHDEVLLLG